MTAKTRVNLSLLIFLLLAISCRPDHSTLRYVEITSPPRSAISDKEASFEKMFPLEEMNTRIRFWPLEDVLRDGECDQDLTLENLSENRIVFPSDFGLKIFTFTDSGWREIENLTRYVPPGNRQISPKGPDSPGIIGILFCPNLVGFKMPLEIRIVTVGTIVSVSEEKRDQVGAYIDLVIEK